MPSSAARAATGLGVEPFAPAARRSRDGSARRRPRDGSPPAHSERGRPPQACRRRRCAFPRVYGPPAATPRAQRSTGSTRIRRAPSLLRALRMPATSLAARVRSPPADRGARSVSRCTGSSPPGVGGSSTGPRISVCSGSRASATNSSSASARPSTVSRVTAGGKRASTRSDSSRAAKPAGIDADQGLQRPTGALPDRDDGAAVRSAPDQGDHVEPAAQRLLAGSQVRPQQQQRGVQQHRRGVPTLGRRLGARGGDHDGRRVRHPGGDPAARATAAPASGGTPCPAPPPSGPPR